MLKRQLSHIAFGALFFSLVGCSDNASLTLQSASAIDQSPSVNQAPAAVEQEVNFDVQFSAFLDDANSGNPSLGFAPDIMQGTVVAENLDTGEITTSPIIVNLFDGNAESFSTLNFKPGMYDLTLSFNQAGQYYVGQQSMLVMEGAVETFPVVVGPVIGDALIDVQADVLLDLQFNITPTEITQAQLTDPILEVTLDGDTDLFFINAESGLSPLMWLSVPSGDHTVSVNLLDAGLFVGKSEEQTIAITGDASITIDILPLYGQVRYDLFVEGGSANVEVDIPASVVNSAGGVENLDAFLQVASVDGSSFYSEPLNLVSDANGYVANVVLPDASYGLQTFEVVFFDLATAQYMGSCFEEAALASSGVTVSCQIQLLRESTVSSSLQSAVAVNVFDALGFPLLGATVSVDGEAVGVTGIEANATPGYSSVFVKPGAHIIRADFGGEYGEVEYVAEALSAANVSIILGQTVNNNPALFDENFVVDPAQGLYPEDNFWFACASSNGFPTVVVEEAFQRLALVSNYNDCSEGSAVTLLDFSQPEIQAAGGFEVLLETAGTVVAGAELSIGIGEDSVGDPLFFNPSDSADAVVTLRDAEIEISIYDAGTIVQSVIRPTPFTLNAVDSVVLDVELASMFAGEQGFLNVTVNGNPNFVEAIPFTWDGGSNHIELRGSGSSASANTAKVYIDNMIVRPR